MTQYGAFSDDFYVNMNLSTEMELPHSRESVLHFFEQVRRRYPTMQNFHAREKREYVLEEEKESGAYRWVSTEAKRINSGVVNPQTYEEAAKQHREVLELIPFEMSVSPLDCESLSVMFGFDFTCRGNQNEILAEAIGIPPGLEKFAASAVRPNICRSSRRSNSRSTRLAKPSVESVLKLGRMHFKCERTSSLRTSSVFISPFGATIVLGPNETYAEEFDRLSGLCRDLVDEYLVQ